MFLKFKKRMFSISCDVGTYLEIIKWVENTFHNIGTYIFTFKKYENVNIFNVDRTCVACLE